MIQGFALSLGESVIIALLVVTILTIVIYNRKN